MNVQYHFCGFICYETARQVTDTRSNPRVSECLLLQLRALDWDVDGPFKDYAAVTISHASEDGSGDANSWANVG